MQPPTHHGHQALMVGKSGTDLRFLNVSMHEPRPVNHQPATPRTSPKADSPYDELDEM